MPNNRNKGKVIERWFATRLRDIFPDIRRNAGIQAQSGGVDLENTEPFNIEVKGGKMYKSKMIRRIIDQAKDEGQKNHYTVVLVKPDREESYAIMPFNDWHEVINMYMKEAK